MQKKSGVRKARYRSTSKRATLGKREKRRLIQLGLCLGLFLVVFLGKGNMPADMLNYIRSDADFKGAFTALGEAISKGRPAEEVLGELVLEVFGTGKHEQEAEPVEFRPDSLAVQAAQLALTEVPTRDGMLSMLGVVVEDEVIEDESGAQAEEQPEPEPSSIPQVPEYIGPALPEGATMEYFDLGLSNTVTPVMGKVTSVYGYRDHPVSGEYLFHTGADLAADIGTPVAAFADGVVDFIGESEAYGLYIQLDHGNGVTTFYCHCSDLYAQKGERVTGGQIIAAVGDTGNATGPHLHFELEQNGVLLNPLYYIETEN